MLSWLHVMESRHTKRRKDPSGELYIQTNKVAVRGMLMNYSEEQNVVLYFNPPQIHWSELVRLSPWRCQRLCGSN